MIQLQLILSAVLRFTYLYYLYYIDLAKAKSVAPVNKFKT